MIHWRSRILYVVSHTCRTMRRSSVFINNCPQLNSGKVVLAGYVHVSGQGSPDCLRNLIDGMLTCSNGTVARVDRIHHVASEACHRPMALCKGPKLI